MAAGTSRRFAIVGAGLAGPLMAAYLGQAGYEVDLFERRDDPRRAGYSGGRSINLALSTRGLHALHEVGLADEMLRLAVPMRGRMIHDRAGNQRFQPYDKDPTRCINSVSRGGLNIALLNAAERCPAVRVHFQQRCTEVQVEAPAAEFIHAQTGAVTHATPQTLLGADGAYSAVRQAMQRRERFDYRQDYIAHGYKELAIQPGPGGAFRLEKNALHIWPRRSFMMIALPNVDGSFTCTLFWPFEGASSFAALRSDDDVRRFFEAEFADFVPLVPDLVEQYRANPVGSMVTVRCGPWQHEDKVALLGDAAHAVVPFYGQGMNCAFEDCTELNACLREFAPDFGRALRLYYERRKPNADALADLALRNFVEMRDHTSSRLFHLYKAWERTLHRFAPGYTPLYTMVSFTRTPYRLAAERARAQDRAVALVLAVVALILLLVGFAFLR